jgi:flagellar biosynthesis protein FlhA
MSREKSAINFIANLDFILPVGLTLILAMMIIPVPAVMMDVMLALNISLSFLILLLSSYIKKQLEFSIFPALLLVMTLFRLSLNVASTRLILGQGYAGKVIETFGHFVVKGNYVVGLVVFLIIVIIQFIVITKGAGRIAEVAARFVLDALPGKQMAIDADLSAGVIEEAEARQRRKSIAHEADFYGAMDGASKFVRGDAIAGLIITAINIIGGLIIGVAQMKMSFSEAVTTYTLLTVGDGLVSQIPALLISTAAGLLGTRTASEQNLGREIASQFMTAAKPLYITGGILAFVMLLPGMPKIPFLVLAGSMGLLGWSVKKAGDNAPTEEREEAQKDDEDVPIWAPVEQLEIELGFSLLTIVDDTHPGNLLERIPRLRRKILLETGFRVPSMRIRDNLSLPQEGYRIKIYGVTAGEGVLRTDKLLALPPEGRQEITLVGEMTKDPAFGANAVWIDTEDQLDASDEGYSVVEPEAVLVTHLAEIIRRHGYRLLDRQSTQELLDTVKQDYPTVIEELIPSQLNTGQVQRVLQHLLREGIPISNISIILETLADYAPKTKDAGVLAEMVRHSLRDEIHEMFAEDDGTLYAVSLEPQLDDSLQKTATPDGGFTISPQILTNMIRNLRSNLDRMKREGHRELLIVSPAIRGKLYELLEPMFPELSIISYAELPLKSNLKSPWQVSGR